MATVTKEPRACRTVLWLLGSILIVFIFGFQTRHNKHSQPDDTYDSIDSSNLLVSSPFPEGVLDQSFLTTRPSEVWRAVNISDPRLGDHGNTCPMDVFPCCTGALHNGGGHTFTAGKCAPRRLGLPSYRNYRSGTELIRAVGNRTFVMIGDSVSHQEFGALECACRMWSECRVLSRKSTSFEPEKPCEFWRARIAAVETVKLQVNETIATFQFVRQYQPCLNDSAWHEEDKIVKLAPDILVATVVGAHFSEGALQYPDLSPKRALAATKAVFGGSLVRGMIAAGKPVIFVEAAAQHFPKPGGDFWGSQQLSPKDYNMTAEAFAAQPCLPIIWNPSLRVRVGKHEFGQHQWRGKLVRAALEQELNLSIWWTNDTSSRPTRGSIAWVPLSDLAASRPDMHELVGSDCTHICYDALFWAPFVDSVARAVGGLS